MAKKLYHGACYYPELWDEETIQQDITIMRETGINVVRIGEFAWSVMEPEEGNINVNFLKKSSAVCMKTASKPSCARRRRHRPFGLLA